MTAQLPTVTSWKMVPGNTGNLSIYSAPELWRQSSAPRILGKIGEKKIRTPPINIAVFMPETKKCHIVTSTGDVYMLDGPPQDKASFPHLSDWSPEAVALFITNRLYNED